MTDPEGGEESRPVKEKETEWTERIGEHVKGIAGEIFFIILSTSIDKSKTTSCIQQSFQGKNLH